MLPMSPAVLLNYNIYQANDVKIILAKTGIFAVKINGLLFCWLVKC